MIWRICQKNELTLQKNINNIKERFIQDGTEITDLQHSHTYEREIHSAPRS